MQGHAKSIGLILPVNRNKRTGTLSRMSLIEAASWARSLKLLV